MSKVVGDIAIKVGADTTSLTTGMRGAEASLSKFAKVGAAAVVAVGVAMVALTKQSMANIDTLAKQARAIGLTTSAFQKMTMVAAEAGVESGKLADMLGKMQKNLDELGQGTTTQVDAFARLGIAFTDLQGLAPDEQFARIAASLDAISDPTEKTALSMEVFGRSGRAAINMLTDYSVKAQEAAEFQNRFGIAVSQATSNNVERANDAVGRLGMAMEGLGNTMAGAVAPAVEAVANGLVRFVGEVTGAKVTLEEFFKTLENAKDTLGEDLFNQLVGNPEKIAAMSAELQALADITTNLSYEAGEAQREMTAMASQLVMLGDTNAAQVMMQLADETARARDNLANGAITGQQFSEQLVSINDRAQEVVTSLEGIDGTGFSGVISRIAALGGALLLAKKQADELKNALPGDPSSLETVGDGDGSWLGDTWTPDVSAPRTRPGQQGVDSFGDFIAAGSSGGGGGGGGGMKDMFAQRLEALQEGLATESEVIAEWYLEGQTTLEDALAKKMLTETEYQELRERLEKEHQDRLAGIRDAGSQDSLRGIVSNAEKMVGVVAGGNKKLMKLQAALGVANSWLAFTEVLKDPAFVGRPWERAIAAGQALASGLAAAKNIAKAGDSSGVSGGASTANATTAGPPPAQANITYYGQPTSSGMQTVTERLNEEYKQGYRVNWDFQPI